jgi:hypothetical protein
MDDITRFLMSDSARPSLSKSDLQEMGKRASDMYLGSGTPLSQAVVKVASESRGITAEQVFRVVEAANSATFLDLFEKQAGDRNVNFEICDPRDVLRAMDIQVPSLTKEAADHDYAIQPESLEKTAGWADTSGKKTKWYQNEESQKKASDLEADIAMMQAFGHEVKTPAMGGGDHLEEALKFVKVGGYRADLVAEDLAKAVSLESVKQATAGGYQESNPFGDLVRANQRLDKLAEDAALALLKNDTIKKEAEAAFFHEVKQHMLGGGNFGELTHALSTAGTPGQVKEAMSFVVPELAKHGLDLTKARAGMVAYEMTKGASVRTVNPESSLMQTFAAMVKAGAAQLHLARSVRDLGSEKEKVASMLAKVDHAAQV